VRRGASRRGRCRSVGGCARFEGVADAELSLGLGGGGPDRTAAGVAVKEFVVGHACCRTQHGEDRGVGRCGSPRSLAPARTRAELAGENLAEIARTSRAHLNECSISLDV
jgi:hypothetical protein